MKYAIIKDGVVVNIAEASADFAKAQGWVQSDTASTGDLYVNGVFSAAPPPAPVIPQAVTMRQARRALRVAGMIGRVDAAIATLPSPQKEDAQIEWEYSQEVQRHNGLVAAMAPALGLTNAQIDALFIAAAAL